MGSSASAPPLQQLVISPRKNSFCSKAHISLRCCWFTLLTLFACISMFKFLLLTWNPSSITNSSSSSSSSRDDHAHLHYSSCSPTMMMRRMMISNNNIVPTELLLPLSAMQQQQQGMRSSSKRNLTGSMSLEEQEFFWHQPDGLGFRPCIEFSKEFKQESAELIAQRERYLLVVVNGGLNQQRNQIVDAVIIARILGANLVVPIMEINQIWQDESEFGDIFDVEHFKETLKDNVRVVSALPSTLLMYKPTEEKNMPLNASPHWLRTHYGRKMSKEGVLLLSGLDSRLAKDLPSDLQRLRCKVAFHALKFTAPIQELGDKLAARMWSQGSYLAVHLRLEKDVWVRTGCLPGLGKELDEEIRIERRRNPRLLTARTRMGFTQRKLAGLCPLTAAELVRLLKALGAAERTRIYWAGGEPFGGKKKALEPIRKAFPELHNKDSLATADELMPFKNKASSLAAIDYLVCLQSDVFLQSHGGNFGHLMHGHRAYTGHRKHIVPNKRQMIQHFLNTTMPTAEFDKTIRALHTDSIGQPIQRMSKSNPDVLAYPVPECMCQNPTQSS
ncbi:unnamed protein product [Sphagnum compactum]